jgi:Ca2+-binding EF-hand superfamily protein
MLKVLEALYDLAGVSESDRKGDQSPKSRVDIMIKKLDKNLNNVLEFDEFVDGCMEDEYVRKILIDPMFNC